jgi:nucleoside-diphosphate-sugar epimerase
MTHDLTILVTGAAGFVGTALVVELSKQGYKTIAAVRNTSARLPASIPQVATGNLSGKTDWLESLKHTDIVIHCAARAHIFKDKSADPMAEYLKVNSDATLNLASQAAHAGVKRFIFVSTIGVFGSESMKPLTETDAVNPETYYAISKYQAEQSLLALAQQTAMEIVIIRPPLVYGPNTPGNLLKLMKLVHTGIPLPFGAVNNRRSFVALENLISFIITCANHPKAAGEIFLISDNEAISTSALIRQISAVMQQKIRLIPVPAGFMRVMARLVGKREITDRLFGSLQVDSSKARRLLDWRPVISIEEQLVKTVQAYLNEKNV